MARGRRRTGNKTFPRRSRLWVPFEVTNTLITAGTVTASGDLLANYFGQTGEEVPVGSTIGPVRWMSQLNPAVGTATTESYRLEMGMQLVPEGGRATLPSPGTDIFDSMWYGQFSYDKTQVEIAAGSFSGQSRHEYFNTMAKRKVTGNGQELKIYAVANSNTDYNLVSIGVLMLMLP